MTKGVVCPPTIVEGVVHRIPNIIRNCSFGFPFMGAPKGFPIIIIRLSLQRGRWSIIEPPTFRSHWNPLNVPLLPKVAMGLSKQMRVAPDKHLHRVRHFSSHPNAPSIFYQGSSPCSKDTSGYHGSHQAQVPKGSRSFLWNLG